MKKETLNFLRKHKVIAGVPVLVKFKFKRKNEWANFKAKRGYHVVRWDYVLKAFRMEKR